MKNKILNMEQFSLLEGISGYFYGLKDDGSGWPFCLKKSAVLEHLGWEESSSSYWFCEDHHVAYPEFKNKEVALLFTVIAIQLHNDTISK